MLAVVWIIATAKLPNVWLLFGLLTWLSLSMPKNHVANVWIFKFALSKTGIRGTPFITINIFLTPHWDAAPCQITCYQQERTRFVESGHQMFQKQHTIRCK
jgi:hypothetical protein